uniref:Acyltransferase n=1 Tax=Solanum tuberosum TaxID=4113 RepID=M1B0V7_SOLTU
MVSATVRRVSRVELEPPFNEPYLASSLQDFWGKRWNLMVTNILRPTIYDPIHSMVADRISRKWAPLPAVIATFFVSGVMHELIFYYNGRLKPNGEVMMFFLIHGVALSLEIVIKKIFNGKFLVPRIISGKQAKGMNVESGRGGIDDNGPLPKAKRRILKLASHAMKKEVVPPRLIEKTYGSGAGEKVHL